MANWSKENHMRLNTIKTQFKVISKKQQQSTQQLTATLNDIDLKLVDKYEYLGVVLNNSMNYEPHWKITASKTNCHIYLLKKLRSMGFTEDKLVCIYKSLTLSQYIYGVPLLTSASTRAKKENANTTTSLPKRHWKIHRESSACAQHQAHGGLFSERTMRQNRPKNSQ
jgi:hypothetical protein